MLEQPVLVLNQSYEPLNVCAMRRAIVLVHHGKAEILENGRGHIHTAMAVFPAPSVIRLAYHVQRPLLQRKLTRRELFIRDHFTCQYCGAQTRNLTIDHIQPRSRGGKHLWENLVSACVACNHRKAGRTPREARMKLLREPKAPPLTPYQLFYPYLVLYQEWKKFVLFE